MGELTFGRFQQLLLIHRESLDDELIRQPTLWLEVAEAAALAKSKIAREKHNLAVVTAQRSHRIAARLRKKGLKSTGDLLKIRLAKDSRVQKAHEAYLAAVEESSQWQAMKTAFTQRHSSLKALANLTASTWLQTKSGGEKGVPLGFAGYELRKAEMSSKRRGYKMPPKKARR